MERVDENSGVRSIGGPDDRRGGLEIPDLRPRGELEVHRQSELEGEVAQTTEPLDRPVSIGVGKLCEHMSGPDRGSGFEDPDELLRLLVRAQPGEFHIEHLHAGVVQQLRHAANHLAIADGRNHALAFSHGRHPHARVVIAGVSGDPDQFEGRGAEHRQVSEGEFHGHRRAPFIPWSFIRSFIPGPSSQVRHHGAAVPKKSPNNSCSEGRSSAIGKLTQVTFK